MTVCVTLAHIFATAVAIVTITDCHYNITVVSWRLYTGCHGDTSVCVTSRYVDIVAMVTLAVAMDRLQICDYRCSSICETDFIVFAIFLFSLFYASPWFPMHQLQC